MILPIGNGCAIAYSLQQHNLRKISLPFDWFFISSLKGVNDLIESEFEDIFSDSKIDMNYQDEYNNYKKLYLKYKHVISLHDIKSNNDNYTEANEKLKRRFLRMKTMIRDNNTITILRDEYTSNLLELYPDNSFEIQFNTLFNWIKKINHSIEINFIFFSENTSENKLFWKRHSTKYITNYYITTHDLNNWQRPDVNWKQIFESIIAKKFQDFNIRAKCILHEHSPKNFFVLKYQETDKDHICNLSGIVIVIRENDWSAQVDVILNYIHTTFDFNKHEYITNLDSK